MNGLNMKRIFFSLTLSLIFSSNSFSESSEVLIIDVRTISEWNTGYLKEAKHLPLNQIENKIKNLEPDLNKDIYVYCRSGNRSGKAKIILESLGYKNVSNIGGISEASSKLKIDIIQN